MEQSNDNTEVRNIPKSLGGIEKPNSSIIHTSAYQTGMTYLVKAKHDMKNLFEHYNNVNEANYSKINEIEETPDGYYYNKNTGETYWLDGSKRE